MIGLFDSGLGGLTVLRELRKLLPEQDVLFFADQAHVPYGDKPDERLRQLLADNIASMNDAGATAIVMACNTSCAIASKYGWPESPAPILDLLDAAAAVVEREGYTRIGVIATAATVRLGAYERKIRERVSNASVTEIAAPALVPLVEAGKLAGEEPRVAVAAVCAQLPDDVEAVILACTHYPLLDEHFAAALGNRVARIDPAKEQAIRAAAFLERGQASQNSILRCVTNAGVAAFQANVVAILGPLAARASYERIDAVTANALE